LIKSFEGFRSQAYLDQAGIPTIGWGETKGVKMGDTITKELAEKWFQKEVRKLEKFLLSVIEVPLNQNQFDALVSLVYNIGTGQFLKSTILKQLNAGNYKLAGNHILDWCKIRTNDKLTISDGLQKRRMIEKRLFMEKMDGYGI
jgi:lysozyme